jgi:pimeloyl-ACP methyl ester carboxylesterase
VLQAADSLGLDRFALAGFGFGGWLAAEIATMAAPRLSSLTLVAPFGIRPPEGYIYDQFIGSTETYARLAFADEAAFEAIYRAEPSYEQLEAWETDREMSSRLAWKPYMHNRALPGLLRGVSTPALVVWGEADQVIPAGTAALWRAALPNATIETLAATGHAIDLEQPRALASIVTPFLAAHR